MKTDKNSRTANTREGHLSQSELERAVPTTNAGTASQLTKLDIDRRRQNRQLPTEQLLRLLHDQAPNLWEIAQVVGNWVWVEFNEKPARQITTALSQFGFSWNKKRHSWQHPCGDTRSIGATYDPRQRYGCRLAAEIETAK